ncbi:MAG: O-antigen ligase family protein, partial [Flavobacteriales bacterium]|nr:O-antigen ligase family protein [Flavobacteriales bacterium]
TYGFDDVRKKLALFIIPIFISGFSALEKKEVHFLLKAFVIGVLFSCFWSFCVYFGALDEVIVDKREYSRFTSHVRFGLEIAIAVFIAGYFYSKSLTITHKALWIVILLLLLFTLYHFSFITGTVVVLVTAAILILVFGLRSDKKKIRIPLILGLCSILLFGTYFVHSSYQDFYANDGVTPIKELDRTPHGGIYERTERTANSKIKENGYFLEKNISWKELEAAWNERSDLNFQGNDLKGNILRHTLIRYITSKGQRKDRQAIESLSQNEIEAIEKGTPNYKYLEMNDFRIRLHKIIWEFDAYQNGRNVNGHSILMRWEYLKVTGHIIKNNFWTGVGTGDVQDSYKSFYRENDSVLEEHYRRRGHNQYLTYFVTLGIAGFLWFLFVLLYPLITQKAYLNYLYISFFSILALSMFTEDTLENQVGIYLFVFFNSLLLLSNFKSEKIAQ